MTSTQERHPLQGWNIEDDIKSAERKLLTLHLVNKGSELGQNPRLDLTNLPDTKLKELRRYVERLTKRLYIFRIPSQEYPQPSKYIDANFDELLAFSAKSHQSRLHDLPLLHEKKYQRALNSMSFSDSKTFSEGWIKLHNKLRRRSVQLRLLDKSVYTGLLPLSRAGFEHAEEYLRVHSERNYKEWRQWNRTTKKTILAEMAAEKKAEKSKSLP